MNTTGEQVRALYERGLSYAQVRRALPTANVTYWSSRWGFRKFSPETLEDAKRAAEMRRRGMTLAAIGETLGCSESFVCCLLAHLRADPPNGYIPFAQHIPAATVPIDIDITCPATGEVFTRNVIQERRQLVAEMQTAGMTREEIMTALDGAWSESTIDKDLRAMRT